MNEKELTGRQKTAEGTGRHLSAGGTGRLKTGEGTGRHIPAESTGRLSGVQGSGRMKAAGGTGKLKTAEKPTPVGKQPDPAAAKNRRNSVLGGLALVFVLLLIIALSVRGAADEHRYREHLRAASVSYAKGDYEDALGHLWQAAAAEETDEIRRQMADCYEALGNYDRALEVLRRMDLQDETVRERIAALESARDRQKTANLTEIAGQRVDRTASSLVLKDVGLTDAELSRVAELYALTSLTLSGNRLEDVSALSALGGLTTLDLSDNDIHDLTPLAELGGLRTLYLDNNPIFDFSPLYGLNQLTMLSIRGIEITEAQLSELSEKLPGCAIHSETAVAELREMTLGGVTFRENETELDLSGKNLTDISVLSSCRQLRKLDLSGNQISDLRPLMDLPALERLSIRDNQVSDLRPLMAMSSLRYIDAGANAITSAAALERLDGLKELHLDHNPLSDLSGLASLDALETLDLEGCGLVDGQLEALYGMKSLKLLTLKDNPELTGDAVDALKKKYPSSFISHSELVYTVEFDGERYRRDLTELDLSGRGHSFDLAGFSLMTRLETLDLSGNELESVYSLQWLRSLRTLRLARNRISDATPLAYLTALESLDLSYNEISSVTPLLSLTRLKELNLTGNRLEAEQLEKLREALPDCRIIFESERST